MDGSRISEITTDPTDRVQRLLHLGESFCNDPEDWPDYRGAHGLEPEDIDALIAMVGDPALHAADSGSTEVWAPVHAWRALAQLRAEAAIAPLLTLLRTLEDEAGDQELPDVFAMIGPAAIPQISQFLMDRSLPDWAVGTATEGLAKIGQRWPASRMECIEALVRTLDPHPQQSAIAKGYTVWSLVDLRAVEAIDAIRDAFKRDTVDLTMMGDIEDVEMALGFRTHRVTPAPRHAVVPMEEWSYPDDDEEEEELLPVTPRSEKIGRNQPCPCGSGKKYKKCCLT